MTRSDPPEVDRGLLLRAVVGAVAIGLAVALMGAGLWLSVASRDRGPTAQPTGVAAASASPSPAASGPPGASVGSASPGAVSPSDGASPAPSASSSAGASATPAAPLAPVTTVGTSAVVSAPQSPFAACRLGGPGSPSANSEVEPTVAVDPTRPGTIVAAWQQDRWPNGAARGIVAATSGDAGRTWARND